LPYQQWAELFPRMMDGIIAGAQSAGAKVVYGDNLYMYGNVTGPMTEDTPHRPNSIKGRVRAQVAERLFAAHESGVVRATIGRGSSFYGPGVRTSHVGERLFSAALSGRAALVLGKPDKLHTFTYIEDFGRALVLLGERDEALGKAWHVPSPPTISFRAFIAQVYRQAGTRPRVVALPRWLVASLGVFSPLLREATETLYQFENDFVMDSSRYTTTFGVSATPLETSIRATLDSCGARGNA
jgi:nucleoside-diphosphate-sugar epimerase